MNDLLPWYIKGYSSDNLKALMWLPKLPRSFLFFVFFLNLFFIYLFIYLFYSYFIYLFIYFWLCWVFGSCEGFLRLRQVGATLHRGAGTTLHRGAGTALHRGAWAFHYRGPSRCGAQAPDAQAQ